MKNTCRKGNITELEVQLILIKKGYKIFTPVGDGNKIDMVVIKDNEILRCQVKTSRSYNNCELFNAYATARIRSENRSGTKVKYTKEHIDAFITTDVNNNLYLIPIEKVSTLEVRLHMFKEYIL